MAYHFYLDGVELPVTPSSLKLRIKNQNETVSLINDGEIKFLKAPGLTEIQFDALLPQTGYPFARGGGGASYYLSLLERLKAGKRPFRFLVSRIIPRGALLFDTNLLVSLEEYQVREDAQELGMDVEVSVSLKRYQSYGTRTVQPAKKAKAVRISGPKREEGSPPEISTHKVEAGDCLWNLAKQYLGDGSRYNEIYELNRDIVQNPNLIYVGQELKLPER